MPTHDRAQPRPAADDRVSMAEASVLAGRDRKTLMKDIADGRLPNAIQQAGGRRAWTLLVQDLLDAGLLRADQVEPPRLRGAENAASSVDRLRIIELEAQVHARDYLIEELRGEVARTHEIAMTLAAHLGRARDREAAK